jgi:hypothetical protein
VEKDGGWIETAKKLVYYKCVCRTERSDRVKNERKSRRKFKRELVFEKHNPQSEWVNP